MYYSKEAEVLKKFNTKDGMGIELLRKNNTMPAIITKEDSKIILRRAEKLKIKEVHIGIKDKLKIIEKIVKKYKINFDNIAYIGDDINDTKLLQSVGIAACPANAVPKVKHIANIIHLQKEGGEGAVREFIDIVLEELK